jgi:hypothetical protein
VLNQNELRDQLWLQLSPLYTDSILGQPHDLSLKGGPAATRPTFERNLYGHVQQRPTRQ